MHKEALPVRADDATILDRQEATMKQGVTINLRFASPPLARTITICLVAALIAFHSKAASADCDSSPLCTEVFNVVAQQIFRDRAACAMAILDSPPPWTTIERRALVSQLNANLVGDHIAPFLADVAKLSWPLSPDPESVLERRRRIQSLATSILIARAVDHIVNRFGYGTSPIYLTLSPSRPTWATLKTILFNLTQPIENPRPFINPALSQFVHAYDITSQKFGKRYNPIAQGPAQLYALHRVIGEVNECNDGTVATERTCSDGKDNDQDGLIDTADPSCEYSPAQCAELRHWAVLDRSRLASDTSRYTADFRLLMAAFGSQGFEGGRFFDEQVNSAAVIQEFWFNHFNVDLRKAHLESGLGPGGYEETIHSAMTTTFSELLEKVLLHPAMIRYLDNNRNVVSTARFAQDGTVVASNENLARELLELHTLGDTSEYTQRDMQNVALMLTGINLLFRKEPDSEHRTFGTYIQPFHHVRDFTGTGEQRKQTAPVIMGKLFCQWPPSIQEASGSCQEPSPSPTEESVRQQVKRFVRYLATHQQTKVNICGKLAGWFVARQIDPTSGQEAQRGVVQQRCIAAWGAEGELQAIYGAILTSPQFWSRFNYHRYHKNPMQAVVSAFRSSGATAYDLSASNPSEIVTLGRRLRTEVAYLGLPWRMWTTPDGYPGGEFVEWASQGFIMRWINSSFRVSSLLESLSSNAGREYYAPIMGIAPGGDIGGSNEEMCLDANSPQELLACYEQIPGNGAVRKSGWHVQQRLLELLRKPGIILQQRINGQHKQVPVKTNAILGTAQARFYRY